jgi:AcrR family transcriptional regulator
MSETVAHRRRGAALEQAIFDAVWDELAETGYARMTMEGVAARARTGKQVLYRRWPSRPELVLAAVRARSGSILDRAPDTGSLRRDALELLRHMAARQRELGTETIRGLLLDAAELDPESLTRISELWGGILEHAVRRGEIGPAPVPRAAVASISDLLRYRLLVSAQPVGGPDLEELVDEVFLPLVRAHAGG